MTQWVEAKKGDKIVFSAASGRGSVVSIRNKGFYFMPAKTGMKLNGIKKPIGKFEMFIITDIQVKKFEKHHIVNCHLTRFKDNTSFIVCNKSLQRYFSKINSSSLC